MRIQNSKKLSLTIAALACICFAPTPAFALNFHPSETEWLTWPVYCQARYLKSGAGRKSGFFGRVSAAEIRSQQISLGNDNWHWLHHYCAGIIYIERSRFAVSEKERMILLDKAKNNIAGQYIRSPKDHWFFAEIASAMARIHSARGEYGSALRFIEEAISEQPTEQKLYSLGAVIYRKQGALDKAVDILLRGNQACEEKSAEIHYFLGLIYLERDELDLAETHAILAYELGYPLRGLKTKLANLGRNLDVQSM